MAGRIALGGVVLALAFAAGRASAPRVADADGATLDAFRQALEERDWLHRSHGISRYLEQLGPDELPGALDAVEQHRAWLSQEELRMFMLAWARFDAPGALSHALAWPGRFRRSGAGAAIYAWGFRDPDAALRALDGVDDPRLADFLRTRLVAGWVRSERLDAANRYVASLPDGAQRDSLVGMLARELNEQGSEALLRWAESVPDALPGYKRAVFGRTSAALAATDPEAAVRWAEAHAGREYARGSFAMIAGRWAALDPQAALDWASGLPEGSERDDAVTDGFARWFSASQADAEKWLRERTPSPALDPAVRVVVRRANRSGSPGAAIEWASRIDDEALRREVVVAVGRAWMRREPRAAEQWLANSALPDPMRAEIRSGGEAPGRS